jgi:hypothetical protein
MNTNVLKNPIKQKQNKNKNKILKNGIDKLNE